MPDGPIPVDFASELDRTGKKARRRLAAWAQRLKVEFEHDCEDK